MPASVLTALSILIVEDETLLRRQLTAQLERAGAEVTGVGTLADARQWISQVGCDFVLLDVNLPDGLGTDLLRDKAIPPHTGVIVMTVAGSISGAVAAMKLGALDYLVKPFDPSELPLVVGCAQRSRHAARLEEHRRQDENLSGQTFFFGQSLHDLERQLEKILAADARLQQHLPPVMIEGETGTGKTSLARILHYRGPRAAGPLVEVNCSALPETLAESELFGHERGAFTDARSARLGLFEAADSGSLFLDELPSLSLALQAKVLKVVEDHRLRRLGGNKEIPVDVRIIAATHQNLKDLAQQGRFREDLYHRLDLYRLFIPPLRERGRDILALAELFINRLSQRHRLPRKEFSTTGQQRLLAYPWQGNVRELAHELERALVFEEDPQLDLAHLHPAPGTAPTSSSALDWLNSQYQFPPEGFSLEQAIRRLIAQALHQTHQNVSAAARLLGVSRDYIRYHLRSSQQTESQPATNHPTPSTTNGSVG